MSMASGHVGSPSAIVLAMAKKKRSALKRIRQMTRRTAIKMVARSSARTAVRRARSAIAAGGDEANTAVAEAASALDRAAKRGAIHRNTAARSRSRLAKAAAKKV